MNALYDDEDGLGIEVVGTYSDVGMMSSNAGLVVRDKSGGEFQITVVRSR